MATVWILTCSLRTLSTISTLAKVLVYFSGVCPCNSNSVLVPRIVTLGLFFGRCEGSSSGNKTLKKNSKCIKVKGGAIKMVVGEDIPISENVGGPRFMGKSPGLKALQQWIEAKWKPLIGYEPKSPCVAERMEFIPLSL